MTINSALNRAVLLSILVLFLLSAVAITSKADEIPDSIDAIQSALSNSVSLEGKVVYVDFWASWCVPCRISFPWMQELYDKYQTGGLEIIAVNVDKDHKAAEKFINETKATFPIIFDSTGILAKQYGLEAMPTSFIYGQDGRLISQHRGFRQEEADSLGNAILQLLKERMSK